MSEPIRVLLVDDHTLFRSGIKALLSRDPGLEVVGEAGEGFEGVKRAISLRPDVILLDLHMPGLSGKEALQLILEDFPQAHVVMLTVSENAEDLMETLRAGALGYLLKNIDAEFLLDSVRRAAEGEAVMSAQMTSKLMASVRSGPTGGAASAASDFDRLTAREREILGWVAKGASNKEIARGLELAESTVKIHVQSILKKLGVSSRVQAALCAVENGWAPKA